MTIQALGRELTEKREICSEGALVLDCARNNKFLLHKEKVIKSKALTLIREEDKSFMIIS